MVTVAAYVIGAPGAGKTTLLDGVFRRLGATHRTELKLPVPHVLHEPTGWAEIGRWRPSFGGTDALSYSVMPKAVDWVTSPARPPLLIGEGDRLATDRFFDALSASYDRFVLLYLQGDETAHARAAARAERLGREPQNASWWAGRATKARRLAKMYGALTLDAELDPSHLVAATVAALRQAQEA